MIALIALLALVVAVPTVSAQSKNGGKPLDIDKFLAALGQGNPVTVQGEPFCEFPVTVEQNGKAKPLELPGNRFVVAFPGLTVTLTNEATGKEVTLVITGATHQTIDEDGNVVTVVTGLNLLGDPKAGFVLAKGDFSFVFDKNGTTLIQPLQGKGQLIDICELLS
jgi:hypothetical protein